MSELNNVQYLSTTEFANRYNAMMPIDKDHLPLEPSFVEMLCEKGEIEHSELPAGKGHKKYIYKIPEYELDRVAILINGDEFVKKEAKETKTEIALGKQLLSTKDVSELLGCTQNNVLLLVKKGKLVPTKAEKHGRSTFYKYDEDYILKYIEEHPKRKNRTVEQESEMVKKFEGRINELLEVISKSQYEIERLTADNKRLGDLLVQARNANQAQEPVAKDIFEAYRKGFKDGYEMGGKR